MCCTELIANADLQLLLSLGFYLWSIIHYTPYSMEMQQNKHEIIHQCTYTQNKLLDYK